MGMTFRELRERKQLSQERLADLSGLSLRTIQRAEAGHRVSYASLRALAGTLATDVDLLERELYAVKQAHDDFVEIPKWVRLWNNAFWYGPPRVSRRQAHILEAVCIGGGLVFFAASFLFSAEFMVTLLRVTAVFQLVIGYLLSIGIRIVDNYKLWPEEEISLKEWLHSRPPRTLRVTIIDYTWVLVSLVVFFGALALSL
jgi:transcriptional regulator with XRE-family HTH domain